MRTDLEVRDRELVEKFSEMELSCLRSELMQAGLDNWQAAQVLSTFLVGRGYGVSPEHARRVVTRLEGGRCGVDCMQAEIEKVAWVM